MMAGKFKALGLAVMLAGGLALALPQAARADSFTLSGCSACDGNAYTMSYLSLGGNSYRIDLSIDASGFTKGPAFLMAVAPKVVGWSNAVLTSAPGGVSAEGWSTQSGGLSSGGCNGSGATFFCSDTANQGTFNATGSSTPLDFSWTLNDSNLLTGTDGVALKVQFENSNGSKVGSLLSTDMTLKPEIPSTVPEPATLVLLGSGLLGLGWFVRRTEQS